MQTVRDNTRSSGVEHSMVITLNPETATITSRITNEVGTNTSIDFVYTPEADSGVPLDSDGGQNQVLGLNVVLGQVHGHPKTTTPGMQNQPGTSTNDENTANASGATIYAIDSYNGRNAGVSADIHRVTPDRTHTNNVGKTIGNRTAPGAGQFNIGLDALQKTGGRR